VVVIPRNGEIDPSERRSSMSPVNKQTLGFIAVTALTLVLGAALWQAKPKGTSKLSGQKTTHSGLKLPSSVDGTAKEGLVASYGKLPLSFEANQGQTSKQVKYLTRGPGYTLFLTGEEAVFSLSSLKSGVRSQKGEGRELSSLSRPLLATTDKKQITTDVLRMKLVGASQGGEPTGLGELPGKSNYFISNNPKLWRTNIPTYARVRFTNVYPGIDLVYYGNQGQLEYDFIVAPGADPGLISLAFEGSTDRQHLSNLRIDKTGNVLAENGSSVVRLNKPVIYQPKSSTKRANSKFVAQNSKLVDGHFVLTALNQVRFELGPYDKSQPLVIDPGLTYSTFLGGSNEASAISVAVDLSGNAFITGLTSSTDFPTTSGALDRTAPNPSGSWYVAKVNPTGSGLVYSTYFGGSTTNDGVGGENNPVLAIDSTDNVYLTGYTLATDFPVTAGAFQTKIGNPKFDTAFVTKLNPSGSALVYSTYLGGTTFADIGYAITVDSSGDAYVAGLAGSSDFPITPGAFQVTNAGSPDAFLTELNPKGTGLIFSTFLGGKGTDIASSVVVDSTGAAYVGGSTTSTDFPTKTPIQGTLQGSQDGFITKFAPGGSSLDYSTYFGSTGAGVGAVDALGNAYVGSDVAAKINSAGSALVYSTSLVGGAPFAVDASGNAYFSGVTNSLDIPLVNPIQTTYNGGNDCSVQVLNPTASALVFSTYLGGSEREQFCRGALDSAGHVYIAGATHSINFPVLPGALQTSLSGTSDVFLTRIDLSAPTPVASVTPTSLTFQGATSASQTVTVKNTGATSLTVSKIGFQVPSSAFTETDNCTTSAIAAGASCSIQVTFTSQTSAAEPGLLSVTYNGIGSPQLVTLTVVDYSFTPSPTSMTLTAGGTGSFNLDVAPLGGFSGTVNINCTGAPSLSTCTPSPSSVGLDGLHGGTVAVTVTTTAPTMALLRAPGLPPFSQAGFVMLPMALIAFPLASKRRRAGVGDGLLVLALMLASLCFSCGGGGSSGVTQNPGKPGTPAGTYTLTLTGSSGSLSESTTVSLTVN
jgi:HYDIN/CFA65/VesB family protein/beta-propeller repeat-containing protein